MADLIERIFKHGKTSTAGIAVSAVLVYLFHSFHCTLPENWAPVIYGAFSLPAVQGLLSKDS